MTLHLGPCLDLLRSLPDASVDAEANTDREQVERLGQVGLFGGGR